MAFSVTHKMGKKDEILVYANNLHFATIYKPLPFKRKLGSEWTFRIEHLPLEAYAVYRNPAEALIEVENYINLLNRTLK